MTGAAGIVAIKGAKSRPGLVKRLFSLDEDISAKGLEKASAREFLGGEAPAEMEKTVYAIKQDIDLQYSMHRDGELDALTMIYHTPIDLIMNRG